MFDKLHAPRVARAVVFEGPGEFRIRDLPLPKLAPDELLVEVILAGVDGSELHMFDGAFDWINQRAPLVFGDEIIGRVAAIGADAARTRELEVGDRVTVEARWPCSGCRQCDRGQYYSCERNPSRKGYGATSLSEGSGLWGGYATHVFVPSRALVYRVPNDLRDETALLACSVLANGVRWNDMGGITKGSRVAVIGPGPQGLACLAVAVEAGARVAVLGLSRDGVRLEAARQMGAAGTFVVDAAADPVAAVTGLLSEVDVVIEAAGSQAAKDLAFSLVRQQGVVLNVSVSRGAVVDWLSLMRREVTLMHPLSHPHAVVPAFELARRLLARGLDLGELLTHTFGLEEATAALDTAAYRTDEQPIKVALRPA